MRLKEQAAKCDFTNIDREIKQQIEVHATNGKLRRYAFRNTEKDLQDLLLVGKTLDITRAADTIEKTNGCHTVTEEVNTIADKKWKEKRGGKKYFPRKINHKVGVQIKTCYRCPADDKPCHNCKKLGHFSRCCRSKPQIK